MAEVARRGGVISRRAAVAAVPAHVVDAAVRAGVITVAHPGTYVAASLADDEWCRRAAAVTYVRGTLSHLDALAEWELLPPPPHYRRPPSAPIHLSIGSTRPQVHQPGLVVHRRAGFPVDAAGTRRRRNLPVTSLEQSLVDAWSLLPDSERRTPTIVALRERRTTADRLHCCLAQNRRCAGSADMRALISLVAGGCHSQLEIYGHQSFLLHPLLRRARAQFPVRLPSGLIYLDRYFDEEMVAAEFDGAAYHGSVSQRERDVRRDEALAGMGIQTVRLTHHRLVHDLGGVAASMVRILETRRRQLGLPQR
jgi:very-short-patch-repair endonuclease